MNEWTDWLAETGYGIDYHSLADPPCSIRDLAEAYVRLTGEEDAETWEWCIRENTGAFGVSACWNNEGDWRGAWVHVVAAAEGDCHYAGHGTHEIVHRSVITTDWKPVKP